MAGLGARIWWCLALLAGLLAVAITADAIEPPDQPILRIEAGMHTGSLRRMDMDPAGRYVVTAGHDRTARVWDLASGRLLQVLRPPMGEGNEGKLFAVAISPDGQEVALAGWTGHQWDVDTSVYIMDRSSGRMTRRISGLPNVINHLTYSKDGRRLAVCFGEGGLRVFKRPGYELAWKDSDYQGESYWADFDAQGRLVTSCYDGHLRLYDSNGRRLAKVKTTGGNRPFGLAFSPDGQRLAMGFDDTNAVQVVSGLNLSLLYTPDIRDINSGDLAKVAWSRDGSQLLAGGRGNNRRDAQKVILVWAQGGKGPCTPVAVPASNNVMGLMSLPDGGLVYAGGDPNWGVVDKQGRHRTGQESPTADFRDNLKNFCLSDDGSQVEFGYKYGGRPMARFSLTQRRLTRIQANSLRAPIISAPGLQVNNWEDTSNPNVNGRNLVLKDFEVSRSLALLPDHSGFVLGTEWRLRRYDREGSLKWEKIMPGTVWAVNVAGNGQVLAAALGDGTIRWFRVNDGEELLAFFPHGDQERWVLWTPSGYYDASPGGEDLIGWHINRGKEQAADFFSAGRFRDRFYRPQVMAKILETRDEEQAVRLAQVEKPRRAPEKADLRLPPVVTITSPGDGSGVTTREVELRYSLRRPGNEPVTKVRALIDGRPVGQERGVRPVSADQGVLTINIPPRDVEVTLIAENRFTASEPATVRLHWKGGKGGGEFTIKPKLYVLAIGVGQYRDQGLSQLKFAAKDARDFCAVVEKQKGGLYREVEVKLITDGQATREGVIDGLVWIEQQATQHDVAMIMLSGHGINDKNGEYFFLPCNADLQRLRQTAVHMAELKKTVANLAGKTVMFVDTCHAGNVMGGRKGMVDINAVVNELTSAENGAVVFTASTGNQYSVEDGSWSNGAFSKALLEGMAGKADYHRTGRITINMLDLYISERVKSLTDGRQTPTTVRPKTVPDFPVVLVNK